ncbi:PhbF [hydrothermal vent metagenome]|uniref:PhbF n=1 Tax=hydrothermal vent metagenome TaxID=652676 RepID=A0A3B0R880_9ZZZZ
MAKKNRQDGDQIIIKKYANRRLYNTDSSCYVTLDDLAEMVKENKDFVVRDAKSGEDITHSVLTQIIFEEESKGETMLPVNFMRQLISFYGDGLQKVVPDYLESSMAAFTQNQEKFRGFFKENALNTGLSMQPMKPFEEMAKQNMAIFEQTMSLFSPFAVSRGSDKGEKTAARKPADKTESQQDSATGVDNDQLSDLQAQLAAMQAQINSLQKK